MLKVTLKFGFYSVIVLFSACSGEVRTPSEFELQRIKDSVSEARIDSANVAIKSRCDTLLVYQVPKMVDSLLKDTALIQYFIDTTGLYIDADKKVEKVIRQLQADCDSNLLKETYRIALLQQRSKPKRHPKRKA